MPAIITIIQHHSRIYSTTRKKKQVVQTSEREMKFIICTGYNGKVRKSKKATEVLKSVKGWVHIRQIHMCVYMYTHVNTLHLHVINILTLNYGKKSMFKMATKTIEYYDKRVRHSKKMKALNRHFKF